MTRPTDCKINRYNITVAKQRNEPKSHNTSISSDGILFMSSEKPKGYKVSVCLTKIDAPYLCSALKYLKYSLKEKEKKIIKNVRENIMKTI